MSRAWLIFLFFLLFTAAEADEYDGRNIAAGSIIPSEGYCDQPYVVVNADGSWTCVMTTAGAHEGSQGQHIVVDRFKSERFRPGSPGQKQTLDGERT